MSDSVSQIIGRLRFVSNSAPAIYLNERLAEEMFIAQLGAIESFTRSAAREVEGQAGPAIVRVGASRGTTEEVTYDTSDPLTKALLLHSALGGIQTLASPSRSPGEFAEIIGSAYLPPAAITEPPPPENLRTALFNECERQAQVIRALGDSTNVLLPLLLSNDRFSVGSVISQKWLRPELVASYIQDSQVGFGIVERILDDLPLITLIYMRPFY